MICTHCKQNFDEKLNIPRLLIVCGHSLCETCCYRLHINSRVQCPECHSSTFVQSIALLPKNLALISRHHDRDLCNKHHKKYEAFCEKQNMLICIECILQDGHKNHEMDSISNCYIKHFGNWQKKLQKLDQYLCRLGDSQTEYQKHHEQYKQSYSNVKDSITCLFKQIKDMIDRQEEAALSKIKDSFINWNSKFQQKIDNSVVKITTASNLQEQLSVYHNLSQIEFLQNYAVREDLYNSLPQQSEQPLKPISLSFNKKYIIENLTKSLQSLTIQKIQKIDKIQKKTSAFSVSNYSSIPTQLKKATEVTATIKAVRKAPSTSNQSTPTSLCLSNQNKKKVTNKKQILTSSSQNQGSHSVNKIIPSPKQKSDFGSNNLANQIRSDLSAVDPKESLCHSFLSNMTSFLSDRKSIYLIGGFNDQANSIVKLNLFSFNWEEVCQLNTNRSKFGSIANDKQIFLFGGKKGKERVNDSEVYNITTKKWSKFTPMNKIRSGFAVISLGDLLFFIGGNDGDSILNTVQSYNTVTCQWKKKDSMNEARDELAVVVGKNNKIYAIGGFGGKDNQPLKSVEVFDPKTQKWKLIPSLNQPRRALAAAVLADGIYAIGGFDGAMYMSSVEKYQQGDKQWTYVASMNQSRCTHSAVSIFESQQIYVFGGFDYVPLDSVQRYNVISNEWEQICKMPNARFMHSCLLIKQD